MSLANNLVNKPSLIEYENLHLLIMDAPKASNLHLYLRECKKYNVNHIVRISEPTYSKEEVEAAGISLHVSSVLVCRLSCPAAACSLCFWPRALGLTGGQGRGRLF